VRKKVPTANDTFSSKPTRKGRTETSVVGGFYGENTSEGRGRLVPFDGPTSTRISNTDVYGRFEQALH